MLAVRGARFGAEIGTDHGQYAGQLCQGIPGLKLCCVDPWVAYTEGGEIHTQKEMDEIYTEAFKRLSPYACIIERSTSMEAVERWSNDTLDFVFIDGNHEFPFVYEDIVEWTKKVRPGGIIAGHDYTEDPVRKYGVIEAVRKYTEENNIAPWFVFYGGGRLSPCWMFIKQ